MTDARVGDDLHVYAVPPVLGGVVGPAVADPVALDEGAVQQEEVRFVLARRLQQARRPVGEQIIETSDISINSPGTSLAALHDPSL